MAPNLDYEKLYAVQDTVLDTLYSEDTIFYLTGGTCINRFYSEKRNSDDLDLFTCDNNLFRQYIRNAYDTFDEKKISFEVVADSKDFVRIRVADILRIDFVNDRSFYYGNTIRNKKGYILDNPINMVSNKLSALIGRDEPKDIFDLFLLSTITDFNWNTITEIAREKELFEYDILEYRLKTFPVELLNRLSVRDPVFLSIVKSDYSSMADDIIAGSYNSLYMKY